MKKIEHINFIENLSVAFSAGRQTCDARVSSGIIKHLRRPSVAVWKIDNIA